MASNRSIMFISIIVLWVLAIPLTAASEDVPVHTIDPFEDSIAGHTHQLLRKRKCGIGGKAMATTKDITLTTYLALF